MALVTEYFELLIRGHDVEETHHELYRKLLESYNFHSVWSKDIRTIECELSLPLRPFGVVKFKANVAFELLDFTDRDEPNAEADTLLKGVCKFNGNQLAALGQKAINYVHTSFEYLLLFRETR